MSKVTNPIDALRVLGHSRVRVIETPIEVRSTALQLHHTV